MVESDSEVRIVGIAAAFSELGCFLKITIFQMEVNRSDHYCVLFSLDSTFMHHHYTPQGVAHQTTTGKLVTGVC